LELHEVQEETETEDLEDSRLRRLDLEDSRLQRLDRVKDQHSSRNSKRQRSTERTLVHHVTDPSLEDGTRQHKNFCVLSKT